MEPLSMELAGLAISGVQVEGHLVGGDLEPVIRPDDRPEILHPGPATAPFTPRAKSRGGHAFVQLPVQSRWARRSWAST
jgi:hypothetical protein